MARNINGKPQVPAAVERFVKQIVITMKAVLLYPSASSIPRENAQEAVDILRTILGDSHEARLGVSKTGLVFEGLPVFEGGVAYEAFAQELYNRNLAEVRFHLGMTSDDLVRFLSILKSSTEELDSAGGYENRLWDLGVDSITVRETKTKIVDAATSEDEKGEKGEPWPPSRGRIEEILAAAFGGRPRDQRLLVRIIEDPEAISSYLQESYSTSGGSPEEALKAMRFNELAHMISKQPEEKRPALLRALAEAVKGLEHEVRRRFVTEKLLVDARSDETMASVVRQMDIDDVCKLLIEGLDEDEATVDGLARAVRNLALISLADREEVFMAAGASMREAGMSESFIDDVFETAAPKRLMIDEHGGVNVEEQPIDAVLKFVDMATVTSTYRFTDDSAVLEIQEESRAGFTDGDVVRALVTLISVDAGGERFGEIAAMLEDVIVLQIERGDYDVAADAAQALSDVAEDMDIPRDRRERVSGILASLASLDAMTSVTKAMRVYRPGTTEHDACKYLLESLGRTAIDSLLEVLADEPDMSARKALVDLISDIAVDHIDELGARVSDQRWYVVRNVISILGKTHSSAILPSLERTLRHSDARVRRETIRALSGVHDRLANEMLIAALQDSDSQNVQLAARYLGVAGERGAVRALQQVAKGEGRGSRDIGPRAEAIEALGRIGDARSVPLIRSLIEKRSILGSSKTKELRSAAASALRMIESSGDDRDE